MLISCILGGHKANNVLFQKGHVPYLSEETSTGAEELSRKEISVKTAFPRPSEIRVNLDSLDEVAQSLRQQLGNLDPLSGWMEKSLSRSLKSSF